MYPHNEQIRLEIAIAASKLTQKYKDRLLEFKKFGLLNVTDNIHVSLLLGPGEYEDYSDWPKNVSVTAFQCRSHHPAAKISEYYSNVLPNCNFDADWYMKVDDDSITDVNHLLRSLEAYQESYPIYLCAYLNGNLDREEHKLLSNLSLKDKLIGTPCSKIWHEWECAILNRPAIKKLLANKLSRTIFQERMTIESGSSDQTLGIACKVANIAPMDCEFLKKDPLIYDFSLNKGNVSHIHYISKDVNEHLFEIIKILSGGPAPLRPNRKLYSGVRFRFFSVVDGNKKEICELKLLPSGFIEGGNSNETIWTDYPGHLQFFRQDSILTTDFHRTNDGCFEGVYLRNKKIVHRLEPMDTSIIPTKILV